MALDDCLDLLDALKLPDPSLDRLSFSSHKPARITAWSETLPLTNINQCSVILYKAMPEICELKTTPDTRFELLKIMRPLIRQCTRHLAGEFLNQPIILPEKNMKMAVIAQALQRHLNEGYMLCAKEWIQSGKKMPSQRLSDSIYHAINGISVRLLRSYQLYLPRPPGFWRRLHNMYQLSLDLGLENTPVRDDYLIHNSRSTCEKAYLRTLVLSASGTNKLRQGDLETLYNGLETWASMVKLESIFIDEKDHLFWVALNSDKAPFYRHRLKGAPDPSTMAMDFTQLFHELSKDNDHLKKIPVMDQVVKHWQTSAQRQEERHSASNIVDICPGLSSIHKVLLGDQSFEDFLSHRIDTNEFDIHDDVNQLPSSPTSELDISTAVTSDISNGGLCLQWAKDVPPKIKVGEAIAIRQTGESLWRFGIVRWIRRHQHLGFAGVRFLGNHMMASAASTTFTDGTNSPYFRTIKLDDNTLVTPAVPFSCGQKVRIRKEGQPSRATLNKLTLSTGSVSIFSIKSIRTIEHTGKHASI